MIRRCFIIIRFKDDKIPFFESHQKQCSAFKDVDYYKIFTNSAKQCSVFAIIFIIHDKYTFSIFDF